MIDLESPPSLYDAEEPESKDVESGRYLYARRPTTYGSQRGWIVQAPAWGSALKNYRGRRFTFLEEYGEFVITSGDKQKTDYARIKERDAVGRPWHTYHEPWRMLFQKGGAKEFPLDQIIAYHWHVLPPYREATFPQLEDFYKHGGTITDYECPECDNRIVVFSSQNQREAARMLRIHLTSAINDRHKYSVADLRALGQDWGIDFESSRVGRARRLLKEMQTQEEADPLATGWVMQEPTELEDLKNLEYQCDVCAWAPLKTNKNPSGALRFHKRQAHGAK